MENKVVRRASCLCVWCHLHLLEEHQVTGQVCAKITWRTSLDMHSVAYPYQVTQSLQRQQLTCHSLLLVCERRACVATTCRSWVLEQPRTGDGCFREECLLCGHQPIREFRQGSWHKCQKPRAPIRNRQTRVSNAKARNGYTILT